MKTSVLTLIVMILATMGFGQAPQQMTYQAVVRNTSGGLLVNTQIGMRASILQGSATGIAVYVETQRPTTNTSGLVTIQIGNGSVVLGSMAGINWTAGPFFIKTETDPTGGTNYTIASTTQLLSVPYALYAGKSGPAGTHVGDMLYWDGTKWVLVPIGHNGQVLTVGQAPDGSSLPQWFGPSAHVISTITPTAVQSTTAVTGVNILSRGGDTGIYGAPDGIFVNTSPIPTTYTYNNYPGATRYLLNTGSANITGAYYDTLAGLKPNTTYYVRAFAPGGSTLLNMPLVFGNLVSFTTTGTALPPVISAAPITAITKTSAGSGGHIIDDGGLPVVASGLVWGTAPRPDTSNALGKTNNGSSIDTGSFTTQITGLLAGTQYYVRAYAANSAGIAYSGQLTFTTLNATVPPSVTTLPVTAIFTKTATGGGHITDDGGLPVTASGLVWGTSAGTDTSNALGKTNNGNSIDTGSFTAAITGLHAGTQYYVRAYAANSAGISYGSPLRFTTSVSSAPAITTLPVTAIKSKTASGGGRITDDGGQPVTASGLIWDVQSDVPPGTIPSGKTNNGSSIDTGSFTNTLTGLVRGIHYEVHAYAINAVGTNYGSPYNFVTDSIGTPTVLTSQIITISATTANCSGRITDDGGIAVTASGLIWGTSPDLDINTAIGKTDNYNRIDTGSFTGYITGLTANTAYYVRAYAVNDSGTAYGNLDSFKTSNTPFVIGQYYGGGIVFYIDSTGQHGLVAALADVNDTISVTAPGVTWWNGQDVTDRISDSFTVIGKGALNTNYIVNVQGAGTYAASLAKNYNGGGYSDWYLPDVGELYLLFTSIKNNVIVLPGINAQNYNPYWSSTEGPYDGGDKSQQAWEVNLTSDPGLSNPIKQTILVGDKALVRAIRSF